MCQSEEITSYGENKMKGPSMKLFATLVFASSLGLRIGLAQTQSGKKRPKAVSVTGCLVKGDEPKEVWLAEKDGKLKVPWLSCSVILFSPPGLVSGMGSQKTNPVKNGQKLS